MDIARVERWLTTNDHDGNPRRLYVAVGPEGEVIGVVNEGYAGTDAAPWLREWADNDKYIMPKHVTPPIYYAMLTLWENDGR